MVVRFAAEPVIAHLTLFAVAAAVVQLESLWVAVVSICLPLLQLPVRGHSFFTPATSSLPPADRTLGPESLCH